MGVKQLLALVLSVGSFLLNPTFAWAATLSLSPASGTFNAGCNYTVDIKLDTAGVQTDGTDAIIFYDQSKITVTSITKGTLYPDYPVAAASNGRISISGLASSPGQSYSGLGTFATINMTVAQQVSSAPMTLTFDFDPTNPTKTSDSNVAQTGTLADVLSQASPGNYTIGSGNCTGVAGSSSPSPKATSKGIGGNESTESGSLPDELPEAGGVSTTLFLSIAGGFLTILGILGLALL
jgi:hypothetical protein